MDVNGLFLLFFPLLTWRNVFKSTITDKYMLSDVTRNRIYRIIDKSYYTFNEVADQCGVDVEDFERVLSDSIFLGRQIEICCHHGNKTRELL